MPRVCTVEERLLTVSYQGPGAHDRARRLHRLAHAPGAAAAADAEDEPPPAPPAGPQRHVIEVRAAPTGTTPEGEGLGEGPLLGRVVVMSEIAGELGAAVREDHLIENLIAEDAGPGAAGPDGARQAKSLPTLRITKQVRAGPIAPPRRPAKSPAKSPNRIPR